jgi:CP family cyanate transporter-like MFS transporter
LSKDSLKPLLIPLALLWLGGTGLRLTVLAVPPVIPLIHHDLNLSETGVALLGSLPPLLFAVAAVPGSLLIARLGASRALLTGLLVVALGAAARGLAGGALSLYAATILMGAGIAVMQPSMPPLVREWAPRRIPFATSVYTNGLLVGETLPVAFTLSLIMPLFGGSWRWSLAFWSLPVLATAAALIVFGPKHVPHPKGAPRRRWWPDWKSGLIWRLAVMFGGTNTLYFATNTFLPDYLQAVGRAEWIGSSLTALNFGQLPASFLMLALAGKLVRKPATYVGLGLGMAASVAGMLLMPGVWVVVWAGVAGFACAGVLILLLALPPILVPHEDVPRLTAGIFTISYSTAVITPVIAGLLWDITGNPAMAFLPAGVAALAVIGFSPVVGIKRQKV